MKQCINNPSNTPISWNNRNYRFREPLKMPIWKRCWNTPSRGLHNKWTGPFIRARFIFIYTGSARINGSRLVNSWLIPRFCVDCHSNHGIARTLAQEQENLCTCVEAYFKVIPSICMAQPYRASFLLIVHSAPSCTRILKTWRIALILISVSWKMAVAHQRAWAPHYFPVIVINSS